MVCKCNTVTYTTIVFITLHRSVLLLIPLIKITTRDLSYNFYNYMIWFKIMYTKMNVVKELMSMNIGVLEHEFPMPIYDRDIQNIKHTQN